MPKDQGKGIRYSSHPRRPEEGDQHASPGDAEAILSELASVFLNNLASSAAAAEDAREGQQRTNADDTLPKHEEMYRTLVEQIPAVVFVAYLDRGMSEAYVSPQIESALGFSQEEWLGDPIRWYGQIHPDDKQRWSLDAAEMFLTGKPLKSAYRVLARSGEAIWFQCEVKMVRRADGRPWFLHGVGFDISELKKAEDALREQAGALQNLSSRLLRLQDEERRRIARELHDSLGQYLAALKMNFNQLLRDPPGKKALRSECDEILERCISETRTLSYLLHPPLLDELGFVAAARWYVGGFASRSGIKVALDLPENTKRLQHDFEVVLFRILQESLTNIHRHSGSAVAEVSLQIDEAEVSLQIRDYGHGMPAQMLELFQKTGGETGIGLSGMRERAHELGGRLEISSDSHGTLVNVTVPVSLEQE